MLVSPKPTMMKLAQIDLDMAVYPRQNIQNSRFVEFLSLFDAGVKFPPIVVCEIRGRERPVLVDGAHRRKLYITKGITTVEVENLGLLTMLEALKEGVKRNSGGSMQLSYADRQLAAERMLKLGAPESEVETLLHLERKLVKSLEEISYTYQGERKVLPHWLTEKKKDGSRSPLISPTQIKEHAKIIAENPRHMTARSTMRFLNMLLENDWFFTDNPEVVRLAKKLYEKLGQFLQS